MVASKDRFAAVLLAITVSLAANGSLSAEKTKTVVRTLKTPGGIEYGLWGTPKRTPAPTLFVLAGTIEGTLGKSIFRQCGDELAKRGYLLVSIDIPCHGRQAVAGKRNGLVGWSARIGMNENIVAECNARLSKVLDHLIKTGVADPKRIAACGTSRGGFLAIHFAAHDKRVKCAAGFAPVTDLAALREFQSNSNHPLVQKLSLANQAEQLAGRPVWVVIGDRDDRVGTNNAFDFTARLSAVARKKNVPSNVQLHIISEPRGHTTPAGAREQAAEWIDRLLSYSKSAKTAALDGRAEHLD